jgi:myosin heavy subunit
VTAACLHLGELIFDDSTYDENGKPCTIKNMDRMNLIARLLGFEKNPQDLVTEIVNKAGTPGQTLRAPYKKNECYDARDSLTKCLFDNMFNWLVDRMNVTILPDNEEDESFRRDTKTIGLLDIFGFENFEPFSENNFEQMCINYVNEKLHKLYISAIFDAEKFELKMEGLEEKVASLKYPDLTSLDVIRLLDEKPPAAGGGAGPKGGKDGPKIGLFNIVNDCST